MDGLRALPSIDNLLKSDHTKSLIDTYGRPLVVLVLRETLDSIRTSFDAQNPGIIPGEPKILAETENRLQNMTRPSLKPVINATGVILHTNLGRAPISKQAVNAIQSTASGYSTLEFNIETGKRGSRLIHAEALLQNLLDVEAAVVVNNNASAVLLALSALANRRRVIISRSQLVEIGGGFRVPDVMKQSGARLVEVGTTNKVHLSDYQQALQEPTALVMRAHRSNFKMVGFTSEPEFKDIVQTAHDAGVFFLDDIGSGALIPTERYGLAHEPMVQESLADGADLVCFSGDKLLGGPQSGIIVGKAALLNRIRKHPLARAVRADKFCLAALSATLLHYLKDEAESAIPIWQMISASTETIQSRVSKWSQIIGKGNVIQGTSTVGGGSLPGETLDTWLLALEEGNADKFLAKLRSNDPPIIARTENDRILLDPRTVLPEFEEEFLKGILKITQTP